MENSDIEKLSVLELKGLICEEIEKIELAQDTIRTLRMLINKKGVKNAL